MIEWFAPETWQLLSYIRLVYNAGFALIMFIISAMPVLIKFEVDETTGQSTPRLKREANRSIDYAVALFFFGIGLNALSEAILFLFSNHFTLGYFLANLIGRFPTYLLAILMIIGTSTKGKELGKALLATEDVLKREAADAHRRAEEYAQLLSIASHDLNSPSKGILGGLRTLNDGLGLTDDETAELLAEMEIAAQMVCDRIDGLSEYNKTRRIGDRTAAIDMDELIEQLCNVLEADIATVDGDVARGRLLPVAGSKVHIAQLFQNLILNSLKYRRDNVAPRIRITARPAAKRGFVQFIVSDNGIGFEADQADKIFQLYRSAHKDKMGTGVGLTIVKNIVTAHGGEVWAEAQPNGGASFYLTLPQAQRN